MELKSAMTLMLAGLWLALAAAAREPQATAAGTPFADVDPFIGTGPAPSANYGQEFDSGDVFPGAAYPTGMLGWSPDTVEHRQPGGYFYPDRTIKGFSLTHFSGRGCTVYQDVPIMPINGPLTASPRAQPALTQATFAHANESAAPGAYAVGLDSGIQVELAATPRTGIGRMTFAAQGASTVVVDAGGSINDVFDLGSA